MLDLKVSMNIVINDEFYEEFKKLLQERMDGLLYTNEPEIKHVHSIVIEEGEQID